MQRLQKTSDGIFCLHDYIPTRKFRYHDEPLLLVIEAILDKAYVDEKSDEFAKITIAIMRANFQNT